MKNRKWIQNFQWQTQEEKAAVVEMNRQEEAEGDDFLAKFEQATWDAAKFLNREFSNIPVSTFVSALESPDSVRFTDSYKKERFEKALAWRDSQVK